MNSWLEIGKNRVKNVGMEPKVLPRFDQLIADSPLSKD